MLRPHGEPPSWRRQQPHQSAASRNTAPSHAKSHSLILCLRKSNRHSKMLRRLRILDFLESYHLQKESLPSKPKVSFASNLQSRHPSSYPHLWPSSSPATQATSNAAKTHAPISNLFILNPFSWACACLATRKSHPPSSRRTSPPAASSPLSRAAASASPPAFLSSRVPYDFLSAA